MCVCVLSGGGGGGRVGLALMRPSERWIYVSVWFGLVRRTRKRVEMCAVCCGLDLFGFVFV